MNCLKLLGQRPWLATSIGRSLKSAVLNRYTAFGIPATKPVA